MLSLLHDLKNENLISELNYQFAQFIAQQQQNDDYSPLQQNLAILLAGLASFNVMQGNSCIDLSSPLAENYFGLAGRKLSRDFHSEILQKIEQTPPLVWQEILQHHIAFSIAPSRIAPLLFQHQRLYLYRYWQAEHQIANYLLQAVDFSEKNVKEEALNHEVLAPFFQTDNSIDWQKVAVATALKQRFCLISGGPGTGKTRTVAILLACLQLRELKQQRPPLNIALVAPTGKAAARLKESISNSLQSLNLPESLQRAIPTQASTIHRLLGIQPYSDMPRYHQQNPLHLDVLIVDEASMIDLFVMQKLLNALKPTTRLIMLGDKDQLASVEAGNVMGELGELVKWDESHYSPEHSAYLTAITGYRITADSSNVPAICDCLCHLRHSYRFDENSGIGRLASLINREQAVKSWQIFADTPNDLELIAYPHLMEFNDKHQWTQHCVQLVVNKAVALYRDYLALVEKRRVNPQAVTVSDIFEAFQQVRFLSALRVSELGVEHLNQQIAEALQTAHLVQFKHARDSYIGKPVLITENAPQLHIFSGDIGIILPDETRKLRVYFETVTDGQHLSISPSRLPAYEPAYVMTVHKSQGSEFVHTLMIMPLTNAPVLTKELLYTAVTRAKKRFTLFSDEKIWMQAVRTPIQRQSGLNAQLLA